MKQAPMKLGPLALLLTVICICLAVLAVLSLATANADLRLAERHAETVQTRYELEQLGQTWLAEMEAHGRERDLLPEPGSAIYKQFTQDGATLTVGLAYEQDAWRVVLWQLEAAWEQDEKIGNLWAGN